MSLSGRASFDTSGVTYMNGMFYHATAFNQPLSFDTSSVTEMGGMFGVRVLLCAPSALAIGTLSLQTAHSTPPSLYTPARVSRPTHT